MTKLFEPSEEQLRIRTVLERTPDGAYLTYKQLEAESKVKMDARGKALMRSAMRSLGRYYRPSNGDGIELEAARNTMAIVTSRVRRVDSSLRRATKTSQSLYERHAESLPVEDRQRLGMVVSLFGAIKAMAKGLTSIYHNKPAPLNTISTPRLPGK